MKRRQIGLSEAWIRQKKQNCGEPADDAGASCMSLRELNSAPSDTYCDAQSIINEEPIVPSSVVQSAQCTIKVLLPSACTEGESLLDEDSCNNSDGASSSASIVIADCASVCCRNELEVCQPNQVEVLRSFVNKGRNFMASWYDKYPQISLCLTTKKLFCLYCRYARKHNLFSTKYNDAFSLTGYDNLRRLLRAFKRMTLLKLIRRLK